MSLFLLLVESIRISSFRSEWSAHKLWVAGAALQQSYFMSLIFFLFTQGKENNNIMRIGMTGLYSMVI